MTRRELTYMYDKKMFKAMLRRDEEKSNFFWKKKVNSLKKLNPEWEKQSVLDYELLLF